VSIRRAKVAESRLESRITARATAAISSTRSRRSKGGGCSKSGARITIRPRSLALAVTAEVIGPARRTAPPLIGFPETSPPITRTSLPNAALARAPPAVSSSDEEPVSTVHRDTPNRCT
jgi:hypothetical protein